MARRAPVGAEFNLLEKGYFAIMATPQVTIIESMNAALAGDFDAVILIGDANAEIPEPFRGAIERAGQIDKRVGKQPLLLTTDVAGDD